MPNPASDAIKHIFVVMLENRSFDHMFAMSGIPGIAPPDASTVNLWNGNTISLSGGAPDQMPADPNHEFDGTVEQLCGKGAKYDKTKPYPAVNCGGFAENFARKLKNKASLPQVSTIMQCVNTATDSPALHALASNFVVCNRWFSSLPGPTWPNRFFVHGASSAGLDHSPAATDLVKWESFSGFKYPKGSVYDKLGKGNYRLYQDQSGPISGRLPQVSAIKGIKFDDVRSLSKLAADLTTTYPFAYTFIEPAYGDVVLDTYLGGTSQHPRDGLGGGDRLIAQVYNALRNSPLWESSLLIVTYDEHGGFYDREHPGKAPPPADGAGTKLSKFGFDFATYGVRVPAVIVSPWVAKGKIDGTEYDHSSIVKTLGKLFGFGPLNDRDKAANDLLHLVETTMRNDCPANIVPAAPSITEGVEEEALAPAKATGRVKDGSNLQAFLYLARKAERERALARMSGEESVEAVGEPIEAKTKAQAQKYFENVLPELHTEREIQQQEVLAPTA